MRSKQENLSLGAEERGLHMDVLSSCTLKPDAFGASPTNPAE